MENPKHKDDNVINLKHNVEGSFTKEGYEKLAIIFMHILDYVNSNLKFLEQKYFEACTKYPYASKYRNYETHKKLLPHHVDDARREGDEKLNNLSRNLCKEEDELQIQVLQKYGIEIESNRQKWNRECEEEDAKNENK